MADEVIDYFDSVGQIATGEIPIPEYPISALIKRLSLPRRALIPNIS